MGCALRTEFAAVSQMRPQFRPKIPNVCGPAGTVLSFRGGRDTILVTGASATTSAPATTQTTSAASSATSTAISSVTSTAISSAVAFEGESGFAVLVSVAAVSKVTYSCVAVLVAEISGVILLVRLLSQRRERGLRLCGRFKNEGGAVVGVVTRALHIQCLVPGFVYFKLGVKLLPLVCGEEEMTFCVHRLVGRVIVNIVTPLDIVGALLVYVIGFFAPSSRDARRV